MKIWLINRKITSAWFEILHVQNNTKLATQNLFVSFNIQQLREEHYEALNSSKDNNTMETIEKLDKLHQTLEDKIGDVM